MAKASIWMRRRRRRASQAIPPMVTHRRRRTRLLRRSVRPQRMIASLPIEATRARFQTRPSNWLLELGRLSHSVAWLRTSWSIGQEGFVFLFLDTREVVGQRLGNAKPPARSDFFD